MNDAIKEFFDQGNTDTDHWVAKFIRAGEDPDKLKSLVKELKQLVKADTIVSMQIKMIKDSDVEYYEAVYSPCVYESAYTTLSIHRSKEGAQRAIDHHRKDIQKEDQHIDSMRWNVRTVKIQN